MFCLRTHHWHLVGGSEINNREDQFPQFGIKYQVTSKRQRERERDVIVSWGNAQVYLETVVTCCDLP